MYEDSYKIVMLQASQGNYVIQACDKEPTSEEETVVFISGPLASQVGLSFTGWNPNFNGTLAINHTNKEVEEIAMGNEMLDQFQQMNEALKELISSTPF